MTDANESDYSATVSDAEAVCTECNGDGVIVDRVDGEITCPGCGYRQSPHIANRPQNRVFGGPRSGQPKIDVREYVVSLSAKPVSKADVEDVLAGLKWLDGWASEDGHKTIAAEAKDAAALIRRLYDLWHEEMADAASLRIELAATKHCARKDNEYLIGERDKARADAERMAEALIQAADWFQAYADGHTAKGDTDKAARNQTRADVCRTALAAYKPKWADDE